jgi:uncharacterized membrane protein
MAAVIRKESYQRGPFGLLVKWAFIAFNLMMLLWLISGLVSVAGIETHTKAEQVGHAIGATIGISMVLTLWVMGAIVLGLLALLTRGAKVITEESLADEPPRSSWRVVPESDDGVQNADQIVTRYLERNAQARPSAAAARNAPSVQSAAGFGKRKR